jgi:hypothetical protein
MRAFILLFILVGLLSKPANCQNQFFNFFPQFESPFMTSAYGLSDGIVWNFNNQNSTTLEIKRRIVKTDFTGQTQWILTPDSSNFSIKYACEPIPGALVLAGSYSVQGQFGPQNWGLITRIDSEGNVIWAKRATAQTSAGFTGVYTNGNIIYALFTSYSNFSNSQAYKAAVIAYDLDGNVLWQTPYSHSGFVSNYFFMAADVAENGDLIAAIDVRGSQNTQVSGIVITRISPTGSISWTKHINWHSDFGQSSVNGLVEGPDGNIFLGCRLMTDQSSYFTNSLWIGKFGADGSELDQRIYSAGEDVGENISGMVTTDQNLVVYVKRYSPFETVVHHLDLLAIDYDNLTVSSLGSTVETVVREDVYGEDPPQLVLAPDGSLFSSLIVFCDESQKSLTSMLKWTSDLETDCNSGEISDIYSDSVSSFSVVDYVNSGGSAATLADASIGFIQELADQALSLCNGCDMTTHINGVTNSDSPRFYPNPARDILNLSSEAAYFRISDLSGRLMKQGVLNGSKQIYLNEIPAGLYLLNLDENVSPLMIIE